MLKADPAPIHKEQGKTHAKEGKSKETKATIEAAKTTLHTYSYEVPLKDFCLPSFEAKYFFILFKTVSKNLDHKILFKNRYFHTILRHFISPQAP